MGFVRIRYSDVENAISEIKSVAKRMNSYAGDLDEIMDELGRLPGTDDAGYVSSALAAAKAKRDEAVYQSGRYSNYSEKLKNIIEYAKRQDKAAANAIKNEVDAFTGPRGWLDSAKEFIYNAYVDFLDRLEGLGPLGEMLAQFIRSSVTSVENWKRKMSNWFKYGDGKYLLNIFDALKDIAVALGMVVAALSLIVASAPAWIVAFAFMAVVCGCAYLAMQTIDSVTKINENAKAWELSGGFKNNRVGEFDSNGNITAARYYGDIDGLGDKTKKYDYGNSETNERKERWGTIYDHEKKLMKAFTKTFTAIATLGSAGYAHAADGSYILKDANGNSTFSIKNWVHKNTVDLGFGENENFHPAKSVNIFSKALAHKNTTKISKIMEGDMSNGAKIAIFSGVLTDVFKDIGSVQKTIAAYEHFDSGEAAFNYDTIDKGFDIGGNIPLFDVWTGDGWNIIDNGKKIVTEIFSFSSPEPNEYLSFLDKNGYPLNT